MVGKQTAHHDREADSTSWWGSRQHFMVGKQTACHGMKQTSLHGGKADSTSWSLLE